MENFPSSIYPSSSNHPFFYIYRVLIQKTTLKKSFTLFIAPAFICWCFFSLMGCKNPVIEDKDLLTTDDNLDLAKDTLHVKVFSQFETPITSSGVSTGTVGTLTDPNFGTTYASFYAQCRLTSNNINFGTAPVLDSAVLTLKYIGTYGKFTQAQNVNVYELNESMSDSVSYKTNQSFAVKTPPVATKNNFIPSLTNDTITALNGTLPSHLRMRVDALGSRILGLDTATLGTNAAFLQSFKGFYVTSSASTSGDGLTYFDLSSSVTGITLYYHNSTDDSLFYTLPIAGVTLNHFDNLFTGTPVANSINNPNANGEEKLYLQAGAGTKGKILITDLDSLPKNIVINKAELILTQSGSDTAYSAPVLIDLFRIDDAGQTVPLDDDGVLGFGGVRVQETVNGVSLTRYHFNFKKYFQRLLQGVYRNNGFMLQTYAAFNNAERVVFANSSTNNNYQITILVTYTKL